MGFEFRLGRKMSLDLWGAYNAWEFKNDMSLKHYLVQPELRYWPCQTYEGHFFGLHGHYGHFNIGNIPFIPGMEDKNYRGELYGGGLTWGYHWVIGRHWGLEAFVGAGYAYMAADISMTAVFAPSRSSIPYVASMGLPNGSDTFTVRM